METREQISGFQGLNWGWRARIESDYKKVT